MANNNGVEIEIKIKNINEIKAAFKQAPDLMTKNLDVAIRSTIMYIRGEAVKNAPIRSGRLRASVYNDFSPLKGTIGFKAKYALFVHEGTSPYVIEAREAKALFWKGADHPVKRVNHPGIKANPFLRKAVDSSELTTDKFFQKAVEDTWDKLAQESA